MKTNRRDGECQWKKHPGTIRLNAAWPSLSKLLIQWQREHELTDLEMVLTVAEYQEMLVKNLVRSERASAARQSRNKEED